MLNRRVLGKSAWFAGSSPAMTQKMSPSRRLDLDIGPWSSYIASTRSFKDAFREGIRECGAGAVAAGGRIRPVPRPARASACRYYDRRVRCSLDWDRRRRVTPARPRPRKHGLSCAKGDVSPSGESRGGTPTGERARSKAFSGNGGGQRDRARAAPAGAEVVKQRLSAFRFPLLSVAKGRKRNGPTVVRGGI